jgi:MFS family permease
METASEPSAPRHTWFVKALAITFLMQVAVNAVRPTVSYRALALGADAVQLGLIAAGFALLSLVFSIPIGRMIDRRGEMPFVIVGVLLVSAVSFALVAVQAIWALFVTQAVLGLGQVLTTLGMQALIANSGAEHQHSRFGTFTATVSLGQFVGPTAAGFLSEHIAVPAELTWSHGMSLVGSTVFLAAGGAGFLGLVLALSARHVGSRPRRDSPSPPPEASMLSSVARVLRQPNAPHAMFASIAVLTTTDLLVAYLPAYGESTGLSATTVGLLLSAQAGAAMVSRIFMGSLSRRVRLDRLLIIGTTLPALVLAPLPLLDAPALLLASMVVAGFGLGLGQPLSLVWIARMAPENMRGTAVGVRLSGNRLGQVAVPTVVGGIVGAAGLGAVFVSLAMMLAGSSILTASGAFPTEGR